MVLLDWQKDFSQIRIWNQWCLLNPSFRRRDDGQWLLMNSTVLRSFFGVCRADDHVLPEQKPSPYKSGCRQNGFCVQSSTNYLYVVGLCAGPP